MNTMIRTSLVLALSLNASGVALNAQGTAAPVRLASATPMAAAISGAYDPAEARQRISAADGLFRAGQISAARRAYQAVIDLQRDNGVFPADAMWRLAELYQSENDTRRTALVLDELALESERFGDPKLQARSLLEATILFHKARMPEKALACAERLQPLLASPFISDEFRAEVERRLVRK